MIDKETTARFAGERADLLGAATWEWLDEGYGEWPREFDE